MHLAGLRRGGPRLGVVSWRWGAHRAALQRQPSSTPPAGRIQSRRSLDTSSPIAANVPTVEVADRSNQPHQEWRPPRPAPPTPYPPTSRTLDATQAADRCPVLESPCQSLQLSEVAMTD